jgi:hypothetical protein
MQTLEAMREMRPPCRMRSDYRICLRTAEALLHLGRRCTETRYPPSDTLPAQIARRANMPHPSALESSGKSPG